MTERDRGQNQYTERLAEFSTQLDRLAPVGGARFTQASAQLSKEVPFSRITIQRKASLKTSAGIFASKEPGPLIDTLVLNRRDSNMSLVLEFPAGADMSTQAIAYDVPTDTIDLDQNPRNVIVFPHKQSRLVRLQAKIKGKLSLAEERSHNVTGRVTGILQRLSPDDFVKTELAEVAEAEYIGSDFKQKVEPVVEDLLKDKGIKYKTGFKYQVGDFLENSRLQVQKIVRKKESGEQTVYVVILCDKIEDAAQAQSNLSGQDRLIFYRKYLWTNEKLVHYGRGSVTMDEALTVAASPSAGVSELLNNPEDMQPLLDAFDELKRT